VQCGSDGEIGINFAPSKFVSLKTSAGVKDGARREQRRENKTTTNQTMKNKIMATREEDGTTGRPNKQTNK
jgi:hypothetical protein